MYFYLVFNLMLAAVWVTLRRNPTVAEFAIGFFYGFWSLWLFRGILRRKEVDGESLPRRDYFALYLHTLRFVARFLREVVVANVQVVRVVLSPRIRIRPGIIRYPLDVQTDSGITLLADSITLTPGTLTVDIAPDRSALFIHVLDIDEPDRVRNDIKQRLESYTSKVMP